MTFRTQLLLSRIKERFNSAFRLVFNFFKPKHPYVALVALILIVGVAIIWGSLTFAQEGDPNDGIAAFIWEILSYGLYGIAYALGWIVMQIFAAIIMICSYNNFIGSKAVDTGWVIIRDVCNMLIVIFLLLYAFDQILHLGKFGEKDSLIKILLAAILVNFSKLFCGIMIDIAQVFMMTFVNGFAATAGANLINGLKLSEVLEFQDQAGAAGQQALPWSDVVVMLVFANFFLIGTLIVSIIIAAYLVIRVAVLWMCVVLSPLGFLSGIKLSKLSDYTKKWWDYFINWMLVGPVMAFFLWLSLLVMSDPANVNPNNSLTAGYSESQKAQTAESINNNKSGIGSLDNMMISMMGLGMLFVTFKSTAVISMMSASAIKGAAGKWWGRAGKVPGLRAVTGRADALKKGVSERFAAGKTKREEKYSASAGRILGAYDKGAAFAAKGPALVRAGAGAGIAAVTGSVRGVKEMVGRARDSSKADAAAEGRKHKFSDTWKAMSVGTILKSAGQSARETAKSEWHAGGAFSEQNRVKTEKDGEELSKKKFDRETSRLDKDSTRKYLRDKMISKNSSASDKVAASKKLMDMGDLENAFIDPKTNQVDEVGLRRALKAAKSGMSKTNKKEFDKKIKEFTPHLAYDFSTAAGLKDAQDDMTKGELDYSKMDPGVMRNKQFMALMAKDENKDERDKLFKAMETVSKKSKRREDQVNGGYSALEDYAIAELKKLPESSSDPKIAEKIKNFKSLKDKTLQAHAALTGDVSRTLNVEFEMVPDPSDPSKKVKDLTSLKVEWGNKVFKDTLNEMTPAELERMSVDGPSAQEFATMTGVDLNDLKGTDKTAFNTQFAAFKSEYTKQIAANMSAKQMGRLMNTDTGADNVEKLTDLKVKMVNDLEAKEKTTGLTGAEKDQYRKQSIDLKAMAKNNNTFGDVVALAGVQKTVKSEELLDKYAEDIQRETNQLADKWEEEDRKNPAGRQAPASVGAVGSDAYRKHQFEEAKRQIDQKYQARGYTP